MSRLNKRERDIWYPILVNRDKEYCRNCGRTPKAVKPEYFVQRLLIHETKYERPLKAENLLLLCDRCNQLVHPERQERFKREMSPELQINRKKEPPARSYIMNRILVDGTVALNQLVAATAEKIGISTKTAESYIDKLTSDEGKLIEIFGDVYLRDYEPKMKFDILSNSWVTTEGAKQVPLEIVKQIQAELSQ